MHSDDSTNEGMTGGVGAAAAAGAEALSLSAGLEDLASFLSPFLSLFLATAVASTLMLHRPMNQVTAMHSSSE